MHLGIIGLPQSGKTTVFNALTHGNQPAIRSGGRFAVHTAVVEVPDPYAERLADICQPRKTTSFIVGEDEVRAWTIKSGGTAFDAARVIHSDLQKGFIRAVVIGYEELLEFRGLSEARQHGKLRIEGKNYIVQDGEIVHIRFNI